MGVERDLANGYAGSIPERFTFKAGVRLFDCLSQQCILLDGEGWATTPFENLRMSNQDGFLLGCGDALVPGRGRAVIFSA